VSKAACTQTKSHATVQHSGRKAQTIEQQLAGESQPGVECGTVQLPDPGTQAPFVPQSAVAMFAQMASQCTRQQKLSMSQID